MWAKVAKKVDALVFVNYWWHIKWHTKSGTGDLILCFCCMQLIFVYFTRKKEKNLSSMDIIFFISTIGVF